MNFNSLYFSLHKFTLLHGDLQLQTYQVEDIKQDYDTGKVGFTMVTFKVDFDRMQSLEEAIKTNCSRDIAIFKR